MPAIPVDEFIHELEVDNRAYYDGLPASEKTYWPSQMSPEAAIEALKTRWFNEYMGTVVLARLLEKISHPHLKMLVGRQIGDEAKHTLVCESRIRELGGDVRDYDPPPEQVRMYQVLDEVTFPEEFFAAMQFTTESEGVERNDQAVERFDPETARMFRDSINPDEYFHVQLGYAALKILCTTEETQARARQACHRQRELHRQWTLAYHHKMRDLGLL